MIAREMEEVSMKRAVVPAAQVSAKEREEKGHGNADMCGHWHDKSFGKEVLQSTTRLVGTNDVRRGPKPSDSYVACLSWDVGMRHL